MYIVYWIKAPHHTNMQVEGYIGITKSFNERMKAHKKNKRKSKLTSAKTKYGWGSLTKEILYLNLSQQEALAIEQRLRPTQNIGWNSQKGGELGVESEWYSKIENREFHSKQTALATKAGIVLNDSTEARSSRARKNWADNRESYFGRFVGSKNPRAILTEEEVHFIKYTLIPYKVKDKVIADAFGVNVYVISFIRKGKNWSHI